MIENGSPRVSSAPRSLDIAVTGRCNLDCAYCFYADEMAARDDLPSSRWLAFFEELGKIAVQRVTLTGGEAFTRPDLFELIDRIIANRMRYSILTNGTLIDEKAIEKFAAGKRRLRLDSIQVSIDGSCSDIHDKSRPRSFEKAIRGVRLLHFNGFPVTVRVTVNPFNVDDLENIARLLLEDVGLPGFSTNEAYSCWATARGEGLMLLAPPQRKLAMATLARLSENHDNRISAQAGPLVYAREAKKIQKALAEGETGFPGRGTLCGCGGMWNKMDVLHDGTIVPCHVLHTLRLGSVGEDDFRQIWLDHPTMVSLRKRHKIPLDSIDTCRGCRYIGFCTGGCPQGAIQVYGRIDARNPFNCHRVLLGEDPFFSLTENAPDGTASVCQGNAR